MGLRIDPPPLLDENAPPLVESGRARECRDENYCGTESNNLLRKAQLHRVQGSVRAARFFLFDAVFALDDAGFECESLLDLLDDTSTVLAEWSGRGRVLIDHSMEGFDTSWRADREAALHGR